MPFSNMFEFDEELVLGAGLIDEGVGRRPQRLVDEQFDQTLLQYDSDEIGEGLSDEEAMALTEGPARIVSENLVNGRLQTCATRRMAEHMLKRPLTTEEARDVLPSRTDAFIEDGENFRALVRLLVQSRGYRGE